MFVLFNKKILQYRDIEASRGAGAQSVPVDRLVVGSIPTRGNEIFIYIYIFSGVGVKRSVGFRHSTRNAEFSGKWETECFNTAYPAV